MTATTKESLFDRIAQLLPPEQREHYYQRMAHLQKLNPADEILVIGEAMGFLALIIRETPGQIAAQRSEIERVFTESLRTMQEAHQATVGFVRTVETRIAELPAEIARSLDSEAIALRIGEGIQQSFSSTGLPATATALRGTAADLQSAMQDFSGVATGLTDPKTGAVAKLHQALRSMEREIAFTTGLANTQLKRLRWSMLSGVGILCFGCLIIGIVLGLFMTHALPLKLPRPEPITPKSAPVSPMSRKERNSHAREANKQDNRHP